MQSNLITMMKKNMEVLKSEVKNVVNKSNGEGLPSIHRTTNSKTISFGQIHHKGEKIASITQHCKRSSISFYDSPKYNEKMTPKKGHYPNRVSTLDIHDRCMQNHKPQITKIEKMLTQKYGGKKQLKDLRGKRRKIKLSDDQGSYRKVKKHKPQTKQKSKKGSEDLYSPWQSVTNEEMEQVHGRCWLQ